MRFSPRAWRSFLAANAGQPVVGEIRAGGTSLCFTNTVSRHPISTHLTYRLIPPGYRGFKYMGIYQRGLTTFEERPLFRNRQTNRRQCVNCHTYNAGDPEQYLFQVRAVDAGTVVVSPKHGKKKIQPTLPGGYPYGVYPAWHPSGDYVAFSCNDTFQMFYLNNPGKIEVMDARSDLFLYRLSDGKVTMIEEEPTVFECFPSWSPDGKLLATSSARMPFKELPADGPARGTFSKPFLLPVEDPDAHTRRQFSYNVPELSEGPVRESPRDLRRLVEQ